MITKEAGQRYRLQAKFKRLGLRYNSRERTVFIPEGVNLDEQKKKYLNKMLSGNHSYVIQTEIPTE